MAELVRAACSQNWKQGGRRHPMTHGLGGSLVRPVHQGVRGASQTLSKGISNHFIFSHRCTLEENLPEKLSCCWGGVGQEQAAGNSACNGLQYSNQILFVQIKYPRLRC